MNKEVWECVRRLECASRASVGELMDVVDACAREEEYTFWLVAVKALLQELGHGDNALGKLLAYTEAQYDNARANDGA